MAKMWSFTGCLLALVFLTARATVTFSTPAAGAVRECSASSSSAISWYYHTSAEKPYSIIAAKEDGTAIYQRSGLSTSTTVYANGCKFPLYETQSRVKAYLFNKDGQLVATSATFTIGDQYPAEIDSSGGGVARLLYDSVFLPICSSIFSSTDAQVFCRQMGYIGVKNTNSASYTGSGSVYQLSCTGYETSLSKCPAFSRSSSQTCSNSLGATVECQGVPPGTDLEGSLRLRTPQGFLEGRLEIYHSGEWGTICSSGFTQSNAMVACKSLGYDNAEQVFASYAAGSGRVWLKEVACRGSESSLLECTLDWDVSGDCADHKQDVGVRCTGNPSTRIVGGGSSGLVEYREESQWIGVNGYLSYDNVAAVICHSLGYKFGQSSSSRQAVTSRVSSNYFSCKGGEMSLSQCSSLAVPSDSGNQLVVACVPEFTLSSSGSEAPRCGKSTSISWTSYALPSGNTSLSVALNGSTIYTISDNVGTGTSISWTPPCWMVQRFISTPYSYVFKTDSSYSIVGKFSVVDDASSVRLFGPDAHRGYGVLDMLSPGTGWRSVGALGFNMWSADVACSQMMLGHALYYRVNVQRVPNFEVTTGYSSCTGTEAKLQSCKSAASSGSCNSDYRALGVRCACDSIDVHVPKAGDTVYCGRPVSISFSSMNDTDYEVSLERLPDSSTDGCNDGSSSGDNDPYGIHLNGDDSDSGSSSSSGGYSPSSPIGPQSAGGVHSVGAKNVASGVYSFQWTADCDAAAAEGLPPPNKYRLKVSGGDRTGYSGWFTLNTAPSSKVDLSLEANSSVASTNRVLLPVLYLGGSICFSEDYSWSDTRVLCRGLGFDDVFSFSHRPHTAASKSFKLKSFHCVGTEFTLSNCQSVIVDGPCASNADLLVSCSYGTALPVTAVFSPAEGSTVECDRALAISWGKSQTSSKISIAAHRTSNFSQFDGTMRTISVGAFNDGVSSTRLPCREVHPESSYTMLVGDALTGVQKTADFKLGLPACSGNSILLGPYGVITDGLQNSSKAITTSSARVCAWTVFGPRSSHITLKASNLQIQAASSQFDASSPYTVHTLSIFDGNSSLAPLAKEFSSEDSGKSHSVTTGNIAHILFVTTEPSTVSKVEDRFRIDFSVSGGESSFSLGAWWNYVLIFYFVLFLPLLVNGVVQCFNAGCSDCVDATGRCCDSFGTCLCGRTGCCCRSWRGLFRCLFCNNCSCCRGSGSGTPSRQSGGATASPASQNTINPAIQATAQQPNLVAMPFIGNKTFAYKPKQNSAVPSAPPSGALLYVTRMDNRKVMEVHCPLESNVWDLKQQLAAQMGVSASSMRILFSGQELLNERTLHAHEIAAGTMLSLAVMTGGAASGGATAGGGVVSLQKVSQLLNDRNNPDSGKRFEASDALAQMNQPETICPLAQSMIVSRMPRPREPLDRPGQSWVPEVPFDRLVKPLENPAIIQQLERTDKYMLMGTRSSRTETVERIRAQIRPINVKPDGSTQGTNSIVLKAALTGEAGGNIVLKGILPLNQVHGYESMLVQQSVEQKILTFLGPSPFTTQLLHHFTGSSALVWNWIPDVFHSLDQQSQQMGRRFLRHQTSYLVFPFYTRTLQSTYRGSSTPSEFAVSLDLLQIGLALSFLSSKGVAHADIKEDNFFIDEHGWLRLGDFGCSRQVMSSTNTPLPFTSAEECLGNLGNPAGLSPELSSAITHGSQQNLPQLFEKADVFGAGRMMFRMLLERPGSAPIFPSSSEAFPISALPALPSRYCTFLQNVIRRMAAGKVQERISAQDLVQLMQVFLWVPYQDITSQDSAREWLQARVLEIVFDQDFSPPPQRTRGNKAAVRTSGSQKLWPPTGVELSLYIEYIRSVSDRELYAAVMTIRRYT